MITNKTLDVYELYWGSNDLLLRMGNDQDRGLITREDWLVLYKYKDFYSDNKEYSSNGKQSVDFAILDKILADKFESPDVIIRFKSIIEKQEHEGNKNIFSKILNFLFR